MDKLSESVSASPESMSLLGICASELESRGALYTAQEISQQPGVWMDVSAQVEANRAAIDEWLLPKLSIPGVQVLFAGAGTSAFVGDTLASWLRGRFASSNPIIFEAVSTTSIVADPRQFFASDRPTVLVSFARSGDSPESVGAVDLADDMLSECHHLIITCNPNGKLASFADREENAFALILPERTNDRGFAMTSSYSAMFVACASVFSPNRPQLEIAARMAQELIDDSIADISAEACAACDRIVVIGSGALEGTAREICLKNLELAGGQLTASSDTSLGFRHGPKIIVSPGTVVIQLVSNDCYTSKYDRDLVEELKADGIAGSIIVLSSQTLFPQIDETIDDIWLSLAFIVYGQIFAFLKSYELGISVDSPCPSGEVNRVVQGVTIHPFDQLYPWRPCTTE